MIGLLLTVKNDDFDEFDDDPNAGDADIVEGGVDGDDADADADADAEAGLGTARRSRSGWRFIGS
jgi:hypothetical protein